MCVYIIFCLEPESVHFKKALDKFERALDDILTRIYPDFALRLEYDIHFDRAIVGLLTEIVEKPAGFLFFKWFGRNYESNKSVRRVILRSFGFSAAAIIMETHLNHDRLEEIFEHKAYIKLGRVRKV